MIALGTNVAWSSGRPTMYISFYYEKIRDGANMKYRTQTVINPITGSSYFGYYINQQLYMEGTQKEDVQLKGNSPSQWSNAITYTSPWYTISNKTSGTTTVKFGLYTNSGRSTLWAEYSMGVDPAYPVITSFSVSKNTETSVKFNWTADSVCDWAWYSIDNGSTWADLPVSNIVSGLTANTTYNFKLRVRRTDSQLTATSSTVQQTTYNYPYCTSMPDFTIGNALSLSFYNPLGRTFSFSIISNGTEITDSDWNTNKTSYSGFNAASTQTQLYATIPNVKNATYQIKCVYGNSTITKTGGKVSINEVECKPSITSVAYEDTYSNTILITQDNQKIIRTKSKVGYTATGLIVKNSATISSCSVSVLNNSYNLTVSGTSATGGNATIDSATNVVATFTLTDSRGLTATKDITITMVDWVKPSAIINIQRHNNFYSETDITVNALFSLPTSTYNHNRIAYRYKKVSDTAWSNFVWITQQNNVTVTDTFDNLYEWDIQVYVEDIYAYTYYDLTLPKGMPIMFIDRTKNSVGFNCFPTDTNSVEANGISLENIYSSTSEKKIGTWINGKPLYRRTTVINDSSVLANKTVNVSTSSLNIEEGFFDFSHSYYHTTYHSGSSTQRYLPIIVTNVSSSASATADKGSQLGIFFANDFNSFTIEIGYNWTVDKAVITIEYTKTTD